MLKWGTIKNLNAHCVATKKMKTTPQRMTHDLPTFVLHLPFFLLEREREREKDLERKKERIRVRENIMSNKIFAHQMAYYNTFYTGYDMLGEKIIKRFHAYSLFFFIF